MHYDELVVDAELFITMQHSNMLLCCKVGDINGILPISDDNFIRFI